MKTILVPLDGSALAERALPYVRMLAPRSGAKVDMLRVIPDETKDALFANNPTLLHEAGATDRPLWMREMCVWDLLRYHAEGYLDMRAMSLRGGSWDVDTQVQIGAPAETIVEVADALSADLIAMATHGYGGLKRWVHGSVTDAVVRGTATPVLVIPESAAEPACEPSLKRIMLTLDGSEFAKQALPLATELATRARAELLLFQAVAPPTKIPLGPWPPVGEQSPQRTHACNALRALAGELRSAGIPTRTVVVSGSTAEEIVAAAVRYQVDLIVMATHGYRGLKRWALGSVASKVLHTTSIPLLLVHAGYEKLKAES
jgi:nucleotide-binding universal stress UspA family protein